MIYVIGSLEGQVIDAAFFRYKIETLLVMETTTNWQVHYDAFIAYKEKNPDVPIVQTTTYYGFHLGTWVGTQQAAKIKGTLSDERIKLLEDAGIDWDSYRKRQTWEACYAALIAYKEKHGTTNVPTNGLVKIGDETINLGVWVSNQRNAYQRRINPKRKNFQKIGMITDERIKKLESIGFIWLMRD